MKSRSLSGLLKRSLLSMAMLTMLAVTGAAEDYLLGPMDKLHVRVVEWQSAEAAAREWPSVSGEFTVGPSGKLSLPLIGEIPAAGRTTSEVAAAIGDELQQTLGLLSRPDAAVELAEFRPVFVAGDVQTPGSYAYDPGLTILKAVSLAGGLRRGAVEGMRVERDYINAYGNHQVLAAERARLLARRARLAAEAASQAEIEAPAELSEAADGSRLLAEEAAYMKARDERLTRQLAALDDLKALLSSEVEALESKIATQNRQLDLAREELEGVSGLAERGLTVNTRLLGVERSIAEMEGRVLDMQTASLRARQEINRAERDAETLRSERETEIAEHLRDTEAEVEALDLKIAMHRGLMSEAASLAPAAALGASGGAVEPSYGIVRTVDGEVQESAADENTPVLPGDVIKVAIVPPPARQD